VPRPGMARCHHRPHACAAHGMIYAIAFMAI
jgi:hypothetical protein